MAPGNAPGQRSILGFFQRNAQAAKKKAPAEAPGPNSTRSLPIGSPKKQSVKKASGKPIQTLTPAPSSDAIVDAEDEDVVPRSRGRKGLTGLPSPVTPMGLDGTTDAVMTSSFTSSPSRKVS